MAKRKAGKGKEADFYLVREDVLPDVFIKVIDVKRRLDASPSLSVSEAVREEGISRSAYYKYRRAIRDTRTLEDKPTRTLFLVAESTERIAQSVLNVFYELGATILTFQQDLPINGLVHMLVTFQIDSGRDDLGALTTKLSLMRGIVRIVQP